MIFGRAPAFWWRPPGLASALLVPAGLLYGAVAGRRLARPGARAAIPVVCIGNFTVGGSGKTPTAIWLAGKIRQAGYRPAFLLRGHGGRLAGPLLVEAGRHGPEDVGDEALLLARGAATVVSRDRPAGARMAEAHGADIVVMDDGLQNPSLDKDLCLAVFDGATGLGNGRVLPAGPLRADATRQWPLVDAVLAIGPGMPGDALMEEATSRGLPAFRARLVPDAAIAESLRGRRVLAFAGIGRPAKFFATLGEASADIVVARAFPDHHAFTSAEVARLLDEAMRRSLLPVTTEKDFVRLAPLATPAQRAVLAVLPVRLAPEDPDALAAFVLDRLSRAVLAGGGRGA